jgi:hypothetical protein
MMVHKVDFVYGQIGSTPAVMIDGTPMPGRLMGYTWVVMGEHGYALAMDTKGEKTKEAAEISFRQATAAMTEALANLEAEPDLGPT